MQRRTNSIRVYVIIFEHILIYSKQRRNISEAYRLIRPLTKAETRSVNSCVYTLYFFFSSLCNISYVITELKVSIFYILYWLMFWPVVGLFNHPAVRGDVFRAIFLQIYWSRDFAEGCKTSKARNRKTLSRKSYRIIIEKKGVFVEILW